MVLCGAKTRSGEPCKNHAVDGSNRCRMHGGKLTKAQQGNQHAQKHGIYSATLSDDEKSAWDNIELGKIDDELKLCRIRLLRALRAEQEQQAAEDALELESRTEEPPIIGGLPMEEEGPIVKKAFRRKDYSTIVDRLLGRIESLERTRAGLIGKVAGAIGDGVSVRVEVFGEAKFAEIARNLINEV